MTSHTVKSPSHRSKRCSPRMDKQNKIRKFKTINSIRETNRILTHVARVNWWFPAVDQSLHGLHKPKLVFNSRIEIYPFQTFEFFCSRRYPGWLYFGCCCVTPTDRPTQTAAGPSLWSPWRPADWWPNLACYCRGMNCKSVR